jgi:hypothetical protein
VTDFGTEPEKFLFRSDWTLPAGGDAYMKLRRNGFDFIFLDRIYRIDWIFSPSARSPFGRRPVYPDDPVDPVQFSFKDENPFLIFAVF